MYEPTLAFDDSDETLEPSPPSAEIIASLQLYHNDTVTADVPLRAGVTRVGRAADKCDAVLHDNPTVSQHHVNIDIPLCPLHVTASALPCPFITASHALLDLDAITITNISTSNPACLSATSTAPPRPSDPSSWQLGVGASGRLLRHGMWLRLGSAVMRFTLRDYEEGVERGKRESEKEREAEEAERVSISDQTTQIYNPDAAEEQQQQHAPLPVTSHPRSPHNAAPAGADAGYNASSYSPVFADAEEESMNFMGTLPSNDTGEEGEGGADDASAQPGAEQQSTTEERLETDRAAAAAAAAATAADGTGKAEAMKAEEEAEEAPGSVIVLSGGGDGSASSPIVLSMPVSQQAEEAPATISAQPTQAERGDAADQDEDERSPGAPSPAPLAPGGPSRQADAESFTASSSAGGRKASARTRRVPAAGDQQQREGETVEQRVIREREEQERRARQAAEEKRRGEEEAFRQQEAQRLREREERKRRAEEERRKEAEALQLRREREREERQQTLEREKAERAKQEEKEREEAERRRVEREEQERREEVEEEERQREMQRRIEEETKAAMAKARAKKEEDDRRKREEREEEEERERQRQAAAEAEQARVAELERKRRAEATSQLEWRSKHAPRKGRAGAAEGKLSATSSDASRKDETEASPKPKLAKTASGAGSSSGKASNAGRRTRRQREEKAIEEEEPEREQRAEAMELDEPLQEANETEKDEADEQPAKSALQAVERASSRPGRQRLRGGRLQLSEEDEKEGLVAATKPLAAMETAEAEKMAEQQEESVEAPHAAAEEKEGRSDSTLQGVEALLDMTSPETSPAGSASLSQQRRTRSSSTASAGDSSHELAATPKARSARKRRAADSVVEEQLERNGDQQQMSAPSSVTKRTRTRSVEEARRDDARGADRQQLLSPVTNRGARRGHSLPDSVFDFPARTAATREPVTPNLHNSRRTAASTSPSSSSSAPILLLTGIAEPLQYAEAVSALGGSIAADYSAAVTHLISDRVRRTDKFLACYSSAQHVVSVSWLEASIVAGAFLSPASSPSFPLQDAEAEQRYGFSLSARRRNGHWLRGRRVWCSAHVQPGREAMRRIVEAGGGSLQEDLDADSGQEAVIVIGCEEDRAQCEQLAGQGCTVHDRELLLTGVLRQKLEPELEQFIMLQPTHQPTAKAGRRGGGGRGRGRGRG